MTRKILGILLAVAGLTLILSGIFTERTNMQKQEALKDAFAQISELSPDDAAPAAEQPNLSIDDPGDGATAMIAIPKIDLEVAMTEGIDMKTMVYAVQHFEGTANPGQSGNFSVAGHRNYLTGAFFARVDELEDGDPIYVRTVGLTYKYIVTEKFVVEPDAVWVLDPTEEPTITLVTCTIGGKQRLIIKGVLA